MKAALSSGREVWSPDQASCALGCIDVRAGGRFQKIEKVTIGVGVLNGSEERPWYPVEGRFGAQ
jgi:hypothetical protein